MAEEGISYEGHYMGFKGIMLHAHTHTQVINARRLCRKGRLISIYTVVNDRTVLYAQVKAAGPQHDGQQRKSLRGTFGITISCSLTEEEDPESWAGPIRTWLWLFLTGISGQSCRPAGYPSLAHLGHTNVEHLTRQRQDILKAALDCLDLVARLMGKPVSLFQIN